MSPGAARGAATLDPALRTDTGVDPGPTEKLLGIGQAAVRAGVSERALRYYQQLGLITPSGRTPGGLRRYSAGDLERVGRLRELQTLLGFNLDEIKSVFDNEDRLASLRVEYRSAATGQDRRRELIAEGLCLQRDLRATVVGKAEAINRFLGELDGTIARLEGILEDPPEPATIAGD